MAQSKLFLTSSIDSSRALTDLFDFVWPTAVALWNLQWQTKGFKSQKPDATVSELNSRFVLGSDIHGANLERLATETAWPELQQWFARLLLSETCALFEGWIKASLDEINLPPSIPRGATNNSIDKALQFPTSFNNAKNPISGAKFAILTVQGQSGSHLISSCFLPIQIKNKKYSYQNLDELLVCYRAFKEVRNDFIHHGGRASARTVQAFNKFNILTATALGIAEVPELPAMTQGDPIKLSLRGIVGLSDVVIRLITTYDCLLVNSTHGESLLKRRWLAKHPSLVLLKPAGHTRDQNIIKLIRQCGLPKPVAPTILYTHLKKENLVI